MTQKEYTGPEFEIEFKRADYEWVKGGKVGPDPSDNWQVHCNGDWLSKTGHEPACHAGCIYRWKPAPKRTINIGYMSGGTWLRKELVAPEVDAPWPERLCYVLAEANSVSRYSWANSESEQRLLNAGCVFLKYEDAKAMADWLAVCRKGGQS